jgi:PAS domain S-box-containing protein
MLRRDFRPSSHSPSPASAWSSLARAARRVRRSEDQANAYLAAIIQSSDDAIVSKDLNGIIQKCNPACERMFGYKESELIGRPITVIIPPELQHEEVDILARLSRGERIDHFETTRVTKDGRSLDVALSDFAGAGCQWANYWRLQDRAGHHGHQARRA